MNTTQPPNERADLDLVRAALPAPRLSDDDLARLRAAALRSLATPDRNPMPRRVVFVAAAVAVVVGAGATVAVLSGGDNPAGTAVSPPSGQAPLVGADASAHDVLVTLAAHTEGLTPLTVRPDQFVYSHTRGQNVNGIVLDDAGDEAQVISESDTATWFAADGLRMVRIEQTMNINARPLTEQDARKLAEHGKKVPAQSTMVLPDPNANGDPKRELPTGPTPEPGVDNPTLSWVAGLPTDPEQLLAVFRAAGGTSTKHDTDYLTYKTAVSFAARADTLLTPAGRTALYQAIALLPGIERTPGQVDLAGRAGVAVGRTAEGVRYEIILDPVTSRVLGTRMVAVALPGVPAGTVLAWSANDQIVVDSVGATS
jgi:hypothetical protein